MFKPFAASSSSRRQFVPAFCTKPALLLMAAGIMALGPVEARAQLTLTNIGHLNLGGSAQAVAISNNLLYLANYDDGFRIFNIADPFNPLILGHTNNTANGGVGYGVAVSGTNAFLANQSDGLRVYNVLDSSNPTNIGYASNTNIPGGFANGVAVAGTTAFVANASDGLRIYNIANPAAPVSIGHTNNGGFANGVAVQFTYAYLANGGDGLRIYNVTNPSNPSLVGYTNNGGTANGVAISGSYAYLANGDDGLRIYNISNPSSPIAVGHTNNGGFAYGVAVSSNYAYVANYTDGLRVYDVSNPANPVNVGYAPSPSGIGAAYGVAVSGGFAYVANGGDGLRIYSVSQSNASVVGPTLSIRITNGNTAIITWPAPSTGFYLQQNANLNTTNWSAVTNQVAVISGSTNQVTIAPISGNRFYRLSTQLLTNVVQPQLNILITNGNTAVISWPAPSTGFSLQQITNLSGTNWAAVTNVVVTNSDCRVTITPTAGSRYFRLIYQ